MRPTGAMHLGHFHGALKNWVRLQKEYECFFFVADWHALTTHYEEREVMERYVYDMVVHHLHPEPPARARRAVHAAGHGHAAGLAGTCADLQGPDGEAEGP
jgi:tRNA synthetases class I (W and Y)